MEEQSLASSSFATIEQTARQLLNLRKLLGNSCSLKLVQFFGFNQKQDSLDLTCLRGLSSLGVHLQLTPTMIESVRHCKRSPLAPIVPSCPAHSEELAFVVGFVRGLVRWKCGANAVRLKTAEQTNSEWKNEPLLTPK